MISDQIGKRGYVRRKIQKIESGTKKYSVSAIIMNGFRLDFPPEYQPSYAANGHFVRIDLRSKFGAEEKKPRVIITRPGSKRSVYESNLPETCIMVL